MKEYLFNLSKNLDANMITEDSLGNIIDVTDYENNYEGFSDQEEINHKRKMEAIIGAIDKEIQMFSNSEYGSIKAESGKVWENTPYWSSRGGDILISELENNHLCRIPRRLFNNKIVKNSKDLPPQIVKEIKKRGFQLFNNCIVKF